MDLAWRYRTRACRHPGEQVKRGDTCASSSPRAPRSSIPTLPRSLRI